MRRPDPRNELGLTARAAEQEARILEELAAGPKCNRQLAIDLGLSRSGVMRYTNVMHTANPKRIHVCGFHEPANGGYSRPLYAAGDGVDLVYQPRHVKVPKKSTDRRAEKRAQILALLQTPRTAKQIAARVHFSYCWLADYLVELRKEKVIYIQKWTRPSRLGPHVAVYAIGDERDAKRPGQETRAERYAKERADPVRLKRAQDVQKHNRKLQKLKAKPANIFAALGL